MGQRLELRPAHDFSDKLEEFVAGSVAVKEAFEFGREKHQGQFRQDGREYFTHCVAVANILRSWGLQDERLIVAALLHDVVEDCGVTLDELERTFGLVVSRWVDGVSKLKSDGKTKEIETQRKIVERGFFEPQVILIKLADRVHNMKTLGVMPLEKQVSKAAETLDIYTPLAESLGMWRVKTELEDLAYPYLESSRFQELKRNIDEDPRLSLDLIANLESYLSGLLDEVGLNGRVELRLKGYYEADKKRERLAKSGRGDGGLASVSDLVSFRVILAVNQPKLANLEADLACYAFMGMVHRVFAEQVDMDRFDDFLAAPALNGYRALQTTLRLSQGLVEVAVTTAEHEDFNHWGIISKIRSGVADLREYVQKVVFTPSYKIKFLPKNATGWDFAYQLSPLLGARATEIEINGERRPLSTVIPNAAIVRVIAGENLVPREQDLAYVSGKTRLQMEQQINLVAARRAMADGKQKLDPLLATLGLVELADLELIDRNNGGRQPLSNLLIEFGCTSLDGLFLQLGQGRILPEEVGQVLTRLEICPENTFLSTILVTGRDQPGILGEFSVMLGEMNKNIIGVHTHSHRGEFELRLVVDRLSLGEQQRLISQFKDDSRFKKVVIV